MNELTKKSQAISTRRLFSHWDIEEDKTMPFGMTKIFIFPDLDSLEKQLFIYL